MESGDVKVREAAAWALGFIASHSVELAQSVVDAGSIPKLIISVQSEETTLKRLAIASLGDIASHTPELARTLIDAQAITNIAPLLKVSDPSLRKFVCSTLSHIGNIQLSMPNLSSKEIFFQKFCIVYEIKNLV